MVRLWLHWLHLSVHILLSVWNWAHTVFYRIGFVCTKWWKSSIIAFFCPFLLVSELFEVSPRPVAMSMGSLSSWGCNFIIGMAFPTLQNAWGAFVFLPFSVTCLIMFVITKLYLPETRGSSPTEVAALLAGGFRSTIPRT